MYTRVLVLLFLCILPALTVRSVSSRTQELSVPAMAVSLTYDHLNGLYSADVSVGTPRPGTSDQLLNVYIDTGSLQMWVASTDVCKTYDCAASQMKTFDRSKSSSYRQTTTPFSVTYLEGLQVQGTMVSDKIKIQTTTEVIQLQNVVFGEASKIIDKRKIKREGILGMGLLSSPTDPNRIDTPFYKMLQQSNIIPILGFYLSRNGGGYLVLGGKDRALVESDFNILNVMKIDGLYKGWVVPIEKITLGKKDIFPLINWRVAIDSGATYIWIPQPFFNNFRMKLFKNTNVDEKYRYEMFLCEQIYAVGCLTGCNLLPDVTFTFNGIDYVLTPNDYVTKDGDMCSVDFKGHIDSRSSETGREIIIGQPFMAKYYTRLDMEKRQIGFAKAIKRK